MSGRHTVSYCSDGESFGDYFCKGDCCQGFREAFGSSVCLDEGRFVIQPVYGKRAALLVN